MVHFDETVPQELNIHRLFCRVRQLQPVLRVTRVQVQVNGPAIIKVLFDLLPILEVKLLLGVEVGQHVKEQS